MCGKETSSYPANEQVTRYLEKCVNRLRNTNIQKFQAMCKMHLSFMLDLPNLEELLNDSQSLDMATELAGCKNSGKRLLRRKALKPFRNCSSLPLDEDYVTQVYQLVQYLGESHNICQEGLFRKTGQLSRQKELKARLVSTDALCLDQGEFSAHDCASVLKSHLGDLMEPLLTNKYYKAHYQVPGMMPENESQLQPEIRKRKFHKQVKTVQLLILLLPSINSAVLQLVLDLLHRVSQEPKTKMTAENLGTLFAPHLLCPRDISASELQSVSTEVTKAIAFMIEHAPKLFQVPVDLARDIANYWKQMEEDPGAHPCSTTSINDTADLTGAANMTFGIPLTRQESSVAFNTVVQFVDRAATERASQETDTETALAELYAHVQAMPESSRKRKLLKQFNKTNGGIATPGAEAASSTFFTSKSKSKSIYGSIRKRFCKSSKKELANQSLNVSKENILSSQLTPITAMFAKKKVAKVDHTLTDSPRTTTPKKFLFQDDKRRGTCSDGKVCIVDMNQTAPSALSPQKRKHSTTDEALTPSVKKPCVEPKAARKIEALLSPIPHRASERKATPKTENIAPRSRVPLSVFHSPEFPRDESLVKQEF